MPEAAAVAVTPWRSRLLLGCLLIACVSSSMVQTLLIPVIPAISRDTGASSVEAGWLITATLLTGTALTPVFGRLCDIVGPGRIIIICLVLSGIGAVIVTTGSSIPALVMGRAIQGASLGVIPAGIALVYATQANPSANRTVGWLSSSLGIGGALGVPLGALLADLTGWRVLFLVLAAALLIPAAALLALAPMRAGSTGGRFDFLGAAALSAGLFLGLLPLATPSMDMPATVGLLTLALGLLVLWGLWQVRSREPLVNLTIARSRPVITVIGFSVLTGLCFFANTMTSSLMVQAPVETGYGLGATAALGGLAALPNGLAMIAFAPIAAWAAGKSSPRAILTAGAFIIALGYAARVFLHGNLAVILIGTAVVGIGITLAYACIPMYVNEVAPAGKKAEITSLTVLSRMIGSTVCSAAIANILGAFTLRVGTSHQPSLQAYELIFALTSVAALVAAILALILPRAARSNVVDPQPEVTSSSGSQAAMEAKTAKRERFGRQT